MRRPAVVGVSLGLLLVAALVACGGGSSSAETALRQRLLGVRQLPAGWAAAPVADAGANGPCLAATQSTQSGEAKAGAAFVQGAGVPSFSEGLTSGPNPQQEWTRASGALAKCHSVTVTLGGHRYSATIAPLSFPPVGTQSSAYTWRLTISGLTIDADMVLFAVGRYVGEVTYSELGPAPVQTVEAFANAAVATANGSPTPVTGVVSVASAPERLARTAKGTVAYRMVGHGPPLVLLMGYGGTMRTWDPRFVDALGQRFEVVVVDNAGVGHTQALPSPVSIDAMAEQTSSLIRTLGLGKVDVLGWSMGGMIAQALAVLHPDQVKSLVLCATYPGTGTVPPSQEAIQALSGGQKQASAVLFPADQATAAQTFYTALSRYAASPGASTATVQAQAHAARDWFNGADPAGQETKRIQAPALVADGTDDQLDPVINDHRLTTLLQHAELVLYPDAGHAFLFQGADHFVPAIKAFLATH